MDDPDGSFWPLENWQWDVTGAAAALVVGIVIGFAVPLVT
jgi:uncharacterized membrane-anchored protein YhcB (DUF1043 family)